MTPANMNVAQLKKFCRAFPGVIETLYGEPSNFLVLPSETPGLHYCGDVSHVLGGWMPTQFQADCDPKPQRREYSTRKGRRLTERSVTIISPDDSNAHES